MKSELVLKEEKLTLLAKSGDVLAAYYLGKHYLNTGGPTKALYWFLMASDGNSRYGADFIGKFQAKNPEKFKEIKQDFIKEKRRMKMKTEQEKKISQNNIIAKRYNRI